jgi:L-alanine-DL-glutamate epimerase-like enolase superfamily enzyme
MELGNEQQLPPSLQFAFESLFASTGDQEVKSNAVFSLDDQSFAQAFAQGYRTFKIKVSPQYFPVALLQQWSEQVNLRLDANGSFNVQEFLEAQKAVKVEYWEDPIKDPRQIIYPQVAVALDQYVDCWDRVQEVLQMPAISHLVLKPTVLGGLRITESAIRACLAAGKKFTVTSSLEAEPGRRAILQMMSKIPSGGTSGLSTGKIFAQNFMPDMPNYRLPFSTSGSEQDWLTSLDWRKIRP